MTINQEELLLFPDVVAAPVEGNFACHRDWFVLNIYLDEEDGANNPIKVPYTAHIEVSLYRVIGSGLTGRDELISSVSLNSGTAQHIYVNRDNYSMFGQYRLTARYVGGTLGAPEAPIPLVVALFGEARKQFGPVGTENFDFFKFRSLSFMVTFDSPLATEETFSVTEYFRTSPDTVAPIGTVISDEYSVTVPVGAQRAKIVVDPAFGWSYTPHVTGGTNPKFHYSGLPL